FSRDWSSDVCSSDLFRHDLEHLAHALWAVLDDDRAPARANLHKTYCSELHQGFADRSSRNSETLRQLHLVKSFAGPELAGYDAFFDFISKRLRGVHHHLPIVMHVTWLCIQDN